jgi:hypothetical protein
VASNRQGPASDAAAYNLQPRGVRRLPAAGQPEDSQRASDYNELARLADEHRASTLYEREHRFDAAKSATYCSERRARRQDRAGPSFYKLGLAERAAKRSASSSFLDDSAPTEEHFKRICKAALPRLMDDTSDEDNDRGDQSDHLLSSDDEDMTDSYDDLDSSDDELEGVQPVDAARAVQEVSRPASSAAAPPALSDHFPAGEDEEDNMWQSVGMAAVPDSCSAQVADAPPDDHLPLEGAEFLSGVTRYIESCIQESFPRTKVESAAPPPNWKSKQPSYYSTADSADGPTPEQVVEMRDDEARLARSRQIHTCQGVCYKYGSKTCRFKFPRPILLATSFKDGVILAKRLDTHCNNYNRAILSCLRNNHDVKFLTTGVDAKATIFYITDYVTKSELSHIQTVTLLKVAVDKIDANLFDRPRPHVDGFTESEDIARQRIFTFLNKLDTDVERSGQWCTLVLLGLPLEYKSHSFRSVSANSFVHRALIANPEDVAVDSGDLPVLNEYSSPIIDLEHPDEEVKFTCQYDDYLYRTDLPTDRLYPRAGELHLFSPYQATIANESLVVELAQMCPLRYIQRVEKKKMSDVRSTLPANHLRFSVRHQQYATHIQVVRDVSNPRVPHPIPVFLGYKLPPRSEDSATYAVSILSILTAYSDPAQLRPDSSVEWVDTLDLYLADLSTIDPHLHSWIREIIGNMTCITTGKKEQSIERAAREKLRFDQGLSVLDPDGPNDCDGGDIDDMPDEEEDYFTAQVPLEVLRILPKDPASQPHLFESSTSLYKEVHPSIDALGVRLGTAGSRPSTSCPVSDLNLKTSFESFGKALHARREEMYRPAPRVGTDLPTGWLGDLVLEFGLDESQAAAFMVMALHVLEVEHYTLSQTLPKPLLTVKKVKQMIFSLGGEGGTGKSKVILAFTKFLQRIKLRHKLRIGAITGVAANQVDGSTISSMLRFGQSLKAQGKASDDLRKEFESVTIFFIDEISFVGCENLQHISNRLCELKNCDEPFGGMTVILAGDFYQIQPIGTTPLYKSADSGRNLADALAGYLKFRKVTHRVTLERQYRMAKDPIYMDFVQRYRDGKQKPVTDNKYLQKRRLSAKNPLRTGHLSHLKEDPVIIVEGNEQRYHINMTKAKAMAAATGQKLFFSVAVDKCSNAALTTKLRYELLMLPDGSSTKYGAGILPLLVGMPVVLKTNIGVELGMANGSIGTIVKITLDEREPAVDYGNIAEPHYLQYQPVVHVQYTDGVDRFQLSGGTDQPLLEKGVCPMSVKFQTRRMKFTHKRKVHGRVQHLKIKRKQLWFLPAFAITVNAAQGRTIRAAIVDLSKPVHQRAEKPYVMLSRVPLGGNLGVQGEWNDTLWEPRPDRTMLNYTKRFLQPLEVETRGNVPTARKIQAIFRALNSVTRQLVV